MPINIPLKLKYRTPGRWVYREHVEKKMGIPYPGTPVFNGGRFSTKPRTNSPKKNIISIRPRRRAYGPF